MFTFDYISIFISIFLIFWGFYIFYKKRNEKEAVFLSFFIFLASSWMVSVALTNLSRTNFLFIILNRFDIALGLVSILFFYFFVLNFKDKKINILKSNKILLFFVLLFLLIIFITPGDFLMEDIEFIPNSPPKGVLNLGYTIFFIILSLSILIKSFFRMFKGYKECDKKRQMQIKYFSAGVLLALLGAIFFDIILPWILNDERFYSLGPMSFIFFIGFTSYAIIKHQLLDIKIIIQRSLVYSIVFSFIIGIYLSLLFVAGLFFNQTIDVAGIVIALITTIFSVYTVPMIERYFMRVTDYIFFKDKYDYSEALFDLSEVLNKNINLVILLKKIGIKLKEILKIEQLLIILPERKIVLDVNGKINYTLNQHLEWYSKVIESDNMLLINNSKEAQLAKDKKERNCENKSYKIILGKGKKFHVAMTVPIRLDNKLIGILALGEKLSGDMYSSEDCNLLKTFSYQAAVALEKSQLYEKVKNYSVELEKEVKERTGEIQNLQEEQKLMMLEIAHGMQTPLTIIKGEMHNLEKHIKEKKDIEVLENTIDRISKFIYDMLKLARMENQGDNFKKEKFNLSELVFELAESFEIICNDKNIRIEHDIAKDIFLLGDKSEIDELITNLASNSIKYMSDEREKIIRLELKKETGKIKLVLSDTGVGIDKEGLTKLFNRFYRVNDIDHAGKSGTGLGLAICKEIVEHHKGKIDVQSEKGKGTQFIIYFPEVLV